MKPCVRCNEIPRFHFAMNTSERRGESFYQFVGCSHAVKFGQPLGFIPKANCREIAARWDQLQESEFQQVTALWTEPERVIFRTRIFGKVNQQQPT